MNNFKNRIDTLYTNVFNKIAATPALMTPYVRRFIRMIALPYCLLCLINWQECKKSKIKVVCDLVYIFFRLKYYPFNYSLCRLWEKPKSEWKYYYGSNYEPYQRARLSKEVQRKEYEIIFDDKEICYQICKSYDLPLPEQYGCIDQSENYQNKIISLLESKPNDTLIIKPVRGAGGKDIVVASMKDKRVIIRDGQQIDDIKNFKLKHRSVVQKYLTQHHDLEKIASSFNTLRIATMMTKANDILLIGALIRFGVGTAYVDNTSSGGIAVGVNIEKGTLSDKAFDFNSRRYRVHPDTGICFTDVTIPFWCEVVTLAKKVQSCFKYYKLLGLDIGITESGPVLIEINPAYDNVGLEQSYGPILKNADVLNAYREYNLIPRNIPISM